MNKKDKKKPIEAKNILQNFPSYTNKNNEIFVEPNLDQIYNEDYTKFNITYNIPLQETISFFQDGFCNDDILKKIIATSMKICDAYNKFILNN